MGTTVCYYTVNVTGKGAGVLLAITSPMVGSRNNETKLNNWKDNVDLACASSHQADDSKSASFHAHRWTVRFIMITTLNK